MPPSMVILGVDPGLAWCGFALIKVEGQSRRWLSSRTVKTSPKTPVGVRLDEIGRAAEELTSSADLVVMEDQHGVFIAHLKAGTTNANAARLQEVSGIIRGVALKLGRPLQLVSPGKLRSVLGLPKNAGKEMLARALRLQCSGVPAELVSHESDAGALAVVGERVWKVEGHGRRPAMAGVSGG